MVGFKETLRGITGTPSEVCRITLDLLEGGRDVRLA